MLLAIAKASFYAAALLLVSLEPTLILMLQLCYASQRFEGRTNSIFLQYLAVISPSILPVSGKIGRQHAESLLIGFKVLLG
jgi:hypothetical protein